MMARMNWSYPCEWIPVDNQKTVLLAKLIMSQKEQEVERETESDRETGQAETEVSSVSVCIRILIIPYID